MDKYMISLRKLEEQLNTEFYTKVSVSEYNLVLMIWITSLLQIAYEDVMVTINDYLDLKKKCEKIKQEYWR